MWFFHLSLAERLVPVGVCELAISWLLGGGAEHVVASLPCRPARVSISPHLERAVVSWCCCALCLCASAATMAYVIWRVFMKKYAKMRLGIQRGLMVSCASASASGRRRLHLKDKGAAPDVSLTTRRSIDCGVLGAHHRPRSTGLSLATQHMTVP